MLLANASIKSRGVFRVALAGGSTPQHLYTLLGSDEYARQTDWTKWLVYLGDERLVPPTDNRSNYTIARPFLTNAPISQDTIYLPTIHLDDASATAAEYERMIRESFSDKASEIPSLDLILLGLGSDGHTASLFPDKPALDVQDRLIVESTPGILPPAVDRITFTLPFINAAKHVIFLVSGSDKIEAFIAAYSGTPLGSVQQVPAYLVQPINGDVHWYITDNLVSSTTHLA